MIFIILLSLAGFAASWYAYMVEKKIAQSGEYKPVCDINDRISCTRVMSSPYGKMLGISNAIPGMIFYAFVFVLALFGFVTWIFYLSLTACVASVGLAYIMYFKIKSFCLVCTSVYAINFGLLGVSFFRMYF